MVWQMCDGRNSVAEISDLMGKKFKTPVTQDFVHLVLNELRKSNLLENADELSNPWAGLSRREIVKRVGLTSMIALPLVSSVVAPSAAMAQSGPPCAAPGTIAPNFCSNTDAGCNANLGFFGIICCSGMGVSTAQPCSFTSMACACA